MNENTEIVSFNINILYPVIPIDRGLNKIAMNDDCAAFMIDLGKYYFNSTYFT